MLGALAAATLALGAPPPENSVTTVAPPAPYGSLCKPNGRYEVADPALLYRRDGKARVAKLGALPKANHEKAVLRSVNGCSRPLVVGYEVGR